jgi:adenylate cyclase
MTAVAVHLVVYLAVNGLLLFVWMMSGGPAEDGFWPVWVMVPWGTGLAVHAGIALTLRATRRKRRARRRARRGSDAAAARPADGKSWIAAMFTDIVGSTQLAEHMGDDDWTKLIADYRRMAQTVAEAHHGTIIGTQGDGLLLRFGSPADAVRCGGALQRRFAAERDSGRSLPPVRIGIHAGQAWAVDGDVLGQMVNLAARIAAIAGPDEVLVSEPVADHALPDVAFDDRGLQSLRGASTPRHLLALRWRGVG